MSDLSWHTLATQEDLSRAAAESHEQPVVIFKHSTRCGMSSMARNGLESHWSNTDTGQVRAYLLDLIAHRDISMKIAAQFDVPHQSPQVLLIRNGRCCYNASHIDISYRTLLDELHRVR